MSDGDRIDAPVFDERGLIPVVVQQHGTGEVQRRRIVAHPV